MSFARQNMPALHSPTLAYECSSNAYAHLMAYQLQDAGIVAHVIESALIDGASTDFSVVIKGVAAQIYVEEEHLSSAQELLLRLEKIARKEIREPYCFHCGSNLVNEDDICTDCGAALAKLDVEDELHEIFGIEWCVAICVSVFALILFIHFYS